MAIPSRYKMSTERLDALKEELNYLNFLKLKYYYKKEKILNLKL